MKAPQNAGGSMRFFTVSAALLAGARLALVQGMSHALSTTLQLADEEQLQRALAAFNHTRLIPGHGDAHWEEQLHAEHAMRLLEGRLMQRERAKVRAWANEAPRKPDAFVAWFEQLKESGP